MPTSRIRLCFRPKANNSTVSKNIYRANFRVLSCVAFGLITLSVMAIGLTIWGLRSDAIQEANDDTGNIAAVQSEQLARSIQSVDIVLSDDREQVEPKY